MDVALDNERLHNLALDRLPVSHTAIHSHTTATAFLVFLGSLATDPAKHRAAMALEGSADDMKERAKQHSASPLPLPLRHHSWALAVAG